LIEAWWSIRRPCWDHIDVGASFFFRSGPPPDFFYYLHFRDMGLEALMNLLRFGLVLAKAVQRHREKKRQPPDPGSYRRRIERRTSFTFSSALSRRSRRTA